MFTNQTNQDQIRTPAPLATVEISGVSNIELTRGREIEASVYFDDGKVLHAETWDELSERIHKAYLTASGLFHFADINRDGWTLEQYDSLMTLVDNGLDAMLETLEKACELADASDGHCGLYAAKFRFFHDGKEARS